VFMNLEMAFRNACWALCGRYSISIGGSLITFLVIFEAVDPITPVATLVARTAAPQPATTGAINAAATPPTPIAMPVFQN